jgi:hypothetical protein
MPQKLSLECVLRCRGGGESHGRCGYFQNTVPANEISIEHEPARVTTCALLNIKLKQLPAADKTAQPLKTADALARDRALHKCSADKPSGVIILSSACHSVDADQSQAMCRPCPPRELRMSSCAKNVSVSTKNCQRNHLITLAIS